MKELVGAELYTAVGRIYGGLFPGGPVDDCRPLHHPRRHPAARQPGVPIEEVKAIIEGALERAKARDPQIVLEMVNAKNMKNSFMVDPQATIVAALKSAWETVMGQPVTFRGGSWLGDTASFGSLCDGVISAPAASQFMSQINHSR